MQPNPENANFFCIHNVLGQGIHNPLRRTILAKLEKRRIHQNTAPAMQGHSKEEEQAAERSIHALLEEEARELSKAQVRRHTYLFQPHTQQMQ